MCPITTRFLLDAFTMLDWNICLCMVWDWQFNVTKEISSCIIVPCVPEIVFTFCSRPLYFHTFSLDLESPQWNSGCNKNESYESIVLDYFCWSWYFGEGEFLGISVSKSLRKMLLGKTELYSARVFCKIPVYLFMQEDIQNGVQGRFMDQSTSVREAAVELVGRFILNKPELTHQYYDMIMERILVRFYTTIILHWNASKTVFKIVLVHLPSLVWQSIYFHFRTPGSVYGKEWLKFSKTFVLLNLTFLR